MAVPRSSTTGVGSALLLGRGPSGVVAGSCATCNFGRELSIEKHARRKYDSGFNGRLERFLKARASVSVARS
jgi:hypothetical protein